ncbi:MAG: ribokinase [Promethearchaeota archaeon]|jgi:ribokinase
MSKKTVIIGSSNMDLNVYLKRFPNPGETVTGGTFKQFLGGKGANQAVASVRSGADTIFISKVGADLFGNQMISQLTEEGIDMSYVIRDPLVSSGVAFILINENGENMISVAPGSNFKLNPKEIQKNKDVIKKSSVVAVQMEIPMRTITKVFDIASESDAIKILNPAPLKPIPLEVLQKVDIIIPNEGELYRLHSSLNLKKLTLNGTNRIIQASKALIKIGIKNVITTLGRKGCVIYLGDTDEIIEVPSPKVKAVDTVGAGDCFIGTLASQLSNGKTILNSAKIATVAASIAVTRKGAQESMPFLREIEDTIKKLNLIID